MNQQGPVDYSRERVRQMTERDVPRGSSEAWGIPANFGTPEYDPRNVQYGNQGDGSQIGPKRSQGALGSKESYDDAMAQLASQYESQTGRSAGVLIDKYRHATPTPAERPGAAPAEQRPGPVSFSASRSSPVPQSAAEMGAGAAGAQRPAWGLGTPSTTDASAGPTGGHWGVSASGQPQWVSGGKSTGGWQQSGVGGYMTPLRQTQQSAAGQGSSQA